MIDRAHRARGIIQGRGSITALASLRQSQYYGIGIITAVAISRQTHHTADSSHGRLIARPSHHTVVASHGRRITRQTHHTAVPFSQETCVSERSVLRVCAESDESARSERHRCHARIPHTEGRRVDHQRSKARGKASSVPRCKKKKHLCPSVGGALCVLVRVPAHGLLAVRSPHLRAAAVPSHAQRRVRVRARAHGVADDCRESLLWESLRRREPIPLDANFVR